MSNIVYAHPGTITINPEKNWGDMISYLIIKYFSKSEKFSPADLHWYDPEGVQPFKNGKILAIGSAMLFTKPNDLVWGAGVIRANEVGANPKKVYAVRGPLTRTEMMKKGIEVPEIYGDPALLFPRIYDPSSVIRKKWKLGIIAHYIDYTDQNVVDRLNELERQGVRIINITAGAFHFIDELVSCEMVVSSTLHGLIMSDAYSVPNARIKLTDKITGGDFKYNDYYQSIGREHKVNIIDTTQPISAQTLLDLEFNCGHGLDLDLLLENSPWMDPQNKDMFY